METIGLRNDPLIQSTAPWQSRLALPEYGIAILLTAVVTVISFVLQPITGHAAVALLYLLLVVTAGLRLSRGPVLFMAALSAVVWDYLINPPYLSFSSTNAEDVMFVVMFFVVAVAMGHLTSQLRMNELNERRRQQHTAALYELVRQAGLAHELDTGLHAAVHLTETVFGVRAALLLSASDRTLAEETNPASSLVLSGEDRDAAAWAFTHRTTAGKFTDIFPDSQALHLPLKARTSVMGVFSVQPSAEASFDSAERELLETFAVLIATILEKDRLLRDLKDAEVLRASERLQRALLHSVSHELKTPLAAVQTGLDALQKNGMNGERREVTRREIRQAVRRLHRVINNLLDMSRIESQVIHPKLDWCDLEELVQAAIDLAGEGASENPIAVEIQREAPLVRIDQPLIEQCLCNLLLNAATHSPARAAVLIRARVDDGRLALSVSDEGEGIPETDLPHVFEAFHRGASAVPGGTGLGLAIVDGFVRAHGGNVTIVNKAPRGTEFLITIPVETLRPEAMESTA